MLLSEAAKFVVRRSLARFVVRRFIAVSGAGGQGDESPYYERKTGADEAVSPQ
jgi:hypothetical protein